MSWFLGFFISGVAWLALNAIWPPPGLGEVDDDHKFSMTISSEEGRQEGDVDNNKMPDEEKGSSLG